MTTVTRINADGSIETKTTDTRTLTEKLNGKLTFKERLEAMYPTNPVDVTVGWVPFDDHKRLR